MAKQSLLPLLYLLTYLLTCMYIQTLLFHERPTRALLLSIKNSGLNYWKFPVANGTACPRSLRKEDNFIRYSQILKYSSGTFIWFAPFLQFKLRNFRRTVRVSEIFGSRFPEHPAGMLRERLSWYTLKLLKSRNCLKLLIGKACSFPKKQEPLPSEPFVVAWTHIELTHPESARERRNLSH